MNNQSLKSLRWLHRLYRRHQLYRLLALFCLLVGGGVLAFHLLFFSVELFDLRHSGTNGLFVVLTGLFAFFLLRFLYSWSREGFRISTFFHLWEQSHPEIFNRASLLVYTEKNRDEIEKLGYSTELIQAEDDWLNRFISEKYETRTTRFPVAIGVLIAATVLPTGLLVYTQNDYFSQRMAKIASWLWYSVPELNEQTIRVSEKIVIKRGDPVEITGVWSDPEPGKAVSIHFSNPQTGWVTRSARSIDRSIKYQLPSVNQTTEYFISAGNLLSNKGVIEPIDPPSVVDGEIQIRPPAYTGLKPETVKPLRPVAVPEGTEITVQAQASSEIQAATVVYLDQPRPIQVRDKNLTASFKAATAGDVSIQVEDRFGLVGPERRIRVTSIPDATPTVTIVDPAPSIEMPDSMFIKVQMKVADDYRVTRVDTVMQVNDDPNQVYRIPLLEEGQSNDLDSQNEFYVTFDWDLSQQNLFPGDRVTYFAEAWDNDAIHGPKSSRSKVHVVKYPTLVDLLKEFDTIEQTQIGDLSELVREQKRVTEEAQKTIDRIGDKIDQKALEGEEKESTWLEEKELEALKQRQEELVEEARRLEEQLNEYKEAAEKSLEEAKEDERPQGFTPETLEKIERIQELFSELVDRDSQALLEKIEQTIEQLSQQIGEEQLKDLQFSFQNYEEQLDRTLSMLENAFDSRQLDGLKKMAEELAQRQDHLERETERIEKEQEALNRAAESMTPDEVQAKQEALQQRSEQMAQRQEILRQDAQELQEKMKQLADHFQEKRPDIANKLEQMRQESLEQQLMEEMQQAARNLQQGKPQLAQSNQQKAQQTLQSLSQQLQDPMFDMNQMEMRIDTSVLARLIQQSLYLSHQMEDLTESPLGQSESLLALRKAQVFDRELNRIVANWKEIAQTNPFLNRSAERYLSQSSEKLIQAIQAGQGSQWVGLHEARGSLVALNAAIRQMMSDMQAMQQQMAQSQMDGFQQQMQQMISEQQSLQQMLQQLQRLGEQGEDVRQQLMEMAKQQAQIRKEFEKMMQQYRHAQQMRNRLQGIYQEMSEVEKLLESGINDEQVDEKQKRILTRMLEAGTMQEKDEFGNEREEQVPDEELAAEAPKEPFRTELPEQLQRMVDRPDEETIPSIYREALKNLYIELSKSIQP